MSETAKGQKGVHRPLSPHLQVYNLPYNARMSIIGRAVGVGLALVTVIMLAWFNAVVWVPQIYDLTMTFLNNDFTYYGGLALAFLTFFYIGNGIRHVLWDMMIGVNEKAGILTGNIVLVLSALLTIGLAYCLQNYIAQPAAAQVTQEVTNG